ncbi:hypothetical protein Nmel_018297, partial [Mimus melanotis]
MYLGDLNSIHDKSVDRYLRDEVEDQAPKQNYVSTHKQPKQDSQHWVGHNQLFYQVLSPVKLEREPRAKATKAEQHLNRNLDFLSDPLCRLQENMIIHMALWKGMKLTRKLGELLGTAA